MFLRPLALYKRLHANDTQGKQWMNLLFGIVWYGGTKQAVRAVIVGKQTLKQSTGLLRLKQAVILERLCTVY